MVSRALADAGRPPSRLAPGVHLAAANSGSSRDTRYDPGGACTPSRGERAAHGHWNPSRGLGGERRQLCLARPDLPRWVLAGDPASLDLATSLRTWITALNVAPDVPAGAPSGAGTRVALRPLRSRPDPTCLLTRDVTVRLEDPEDQIADDLGRNVRREEGRRELLCRRQIAIDPRPPAEFEYPVSRRAGATGRLLLADRRLHRAPGGLRPSASCWRASRHGELVRRIPPTGRRRMRYRVAWHDLVRWFLVPHQPAQGLSHLLPAQFPAAQPALEDPVTGDPSSLLLRRLVRTRWFSVAANWGLLAVPAIHRSCQWPPHGPEALVHDFLYPVRDPVRGSRRECLPPGV